MFCRFELPVEKSAPAFRFPPLAALGAVPADGLLPLLAPRPPRGPPLAGTDPRGLPGAPRVPGPPANPRRPPPGPRIGGYHETKKNHSETFFALMINMD